MPSHHPSPHFRCIFGHPTIERETDDDIKWMIEGFAADAKNRAAEFAEI